MTRPDQDPIELFSTWFADAKKTNLLEPTAVALATSSKDGVPSVRMVLLKQFDQRGFVFFTNKTSRKGQEILENPVASLCFHWDPLRRQVRVVGSCEGVSDEEADQYFASRPRTSQIGAWASKQSQPLVGRLELEARIAKYTAQFGVGAVPRPPFWSGFRLVPTRIEFWEDRRFRLHDRFVYERDTNRQAPGEWTLSHLYP